jgi:hypothetical protein
VRQKVAALYVAKGGCYYGLSDVEPWGLPDKDARLYDGPWPVVAHPPCARWGRYWSGGPSAKEGRLLGDDGGCFDAALRAVRKWGGVIEHPAYSYAWKRFFLPCPTQSGGWSMGICGGWSCNVEQGHYGHRARKATWLYAVVPNPPELIWGSSDKRARIDSGPHSAEERAAAKKSGWSGNILERASKKERAATPIPFRDLLLNIARSANTKSLGLSP